MKKTISFLLIFCSLHLFGQGTRILSCDGGGVRGAATLHILKRLTDEVGTNIHEYFDVFAGTSTGSLIAFSLAGGFPIEDILSDYQVMSAKVFTRSSFLTIYKPEYDPGVLRDFIVQILEKNGYSKDATLGDLPKKIVIPVVSLDDPRTGRYTLEIRENFTKEGKTQKIVDVILESTAAPTYFPSEHGCIDGGMGMNDPSLAALMTAYAPGASQMSDFLIFSVGTGYSAAEVPGDESWGVTQWLANLTGQNSGSSPLIEVLMDVQQQIPGQVCTKFLGDSYRKFNFPLTEYFGLDEYEKIPALLKYTDEYIQANTTQWSATCDWLSRQLFDE